MRYPFLVLMLTIVMIEFSAAKTVTGNVVETQEQCSEWHRRAQKGDLVARYNLAVVALTGENSNKKDYDKAVRMLRSAANRGLAQARLALGVLYVTGDHVKKNEQIGITWIREAASAGLKKAKLYLGILLAKEGPQQDLKEARRWLYEASRDGSLSARYNLGLLWLSGRLGEPAKRNGIQYISEAAAGKFPMAQAALGTLIVTGSVADRTNQEGRALLQEAAKAGVKEAQTNLALTMEHGIGGEKDLSAAADWYQRAADQGSLLAEGRLPGVKEFLDSSAPLLSAESASEFDAPLIRAAGDKCSINEVADTTILPRGEFGNYKALVIGNQTYKDLPSLKTPHADAEQISKMLKGKYGFDVTVIKDATRGHMLRNLDALRTSIKDGDNLLIYYAGHGYYDERFDQGYWLPVDSNKDSRANWVSNSDIRDTLRALPAKHILVVADSCYSGTLTRDVNVNLPEDETERLREIVKTKSRLAFTSGGVEPVLDGGGNGHSVFAWALMNRLNKNSGVLRGEELFAKVKPVVIRRAGQHPQYNEIRDTYHEPGGDFVFVAR